jgi:hypothetical protein
MFAVSLRRADVAELVDAHGSGPCGGDSVEVRVLSSALADSPGRLGPLAFSRLARVDFFACSDCCQWQLRTFVRTRFLRSVGCLSGLKTHERPLGPWRLGGAMA